MSLANMSRAFELMRFRTTLAEDELNELKDYLVAWFLGGSDLGARTFLIEVARLRREEVQAAAATANGHATECINLRARGMCDCGTSLQKLVASEKGG